MILKKIFSGSKKLFFSGAKFLLLLAVCALLAMAVVWPLWLFATKAGEVYSIVCVAVFALWGLFAFVKYLEKIPARKILLVSFQILIFVSAVSLAVFCVLANRRILALPVIVAAFLLFGLCRYGFSGRENRS